MSDKQEQGQRKWTKAENDKRPCGLQGNWCYVHHCYPSTCESLKIGNYYPKAQSGDGGERLKYEFSREELSFADARSRFESPAPEPKEESEPEFSASGFNIPGIGDVDCDKCGGKGKWFLGNGTYLCTECVGLAEPSPQKEVSPLVVTRGGVIRADQKAALEEFKAACSARAEKADEIELPPMELEQRWTEPPSTDSHHYRKYHDKSSDFYLGKECVNCIHSEIELRSELSTLKQKIAGIVDESGPLLALAEKATQGPWEIRPAVPYGDGQVIFRGRFEENETIARWNHHYKGTRENIAYIAAASPDFISSLLDRLKALIGDGE